MPITDRVQAFPAKEDRQNIRSFLILHAVSGWDARTYPRIGDELTTTQGIVALAGAASPSRDHRASFSQQLRGARRARTVLATPSGTGRPFAAGRSLRPANATGSRRRPGGSGRRSPPSADRRLRGYTSLFRYDAWGSLGPPASPGAARPTDRLVMPDLHRDQRGSLKAVGGRVGLALSPEEQEATKRDGRRAAGWRHAQGAAGASRRPPPLSDLARVAYLGPPAIHEEALRASAPPAVEEVLTNFYRRRDAVHAVRPTLRGWCTFEKRLEWGGGGHGWDTLPRSRTDVHTRGTRCGASDPHLRHCRDEADVGRDRVVHHQRTPSARGSCASDSRRGGVVAPPPRRVLSTATGANRQSS